jgi:Tfp pilus assembly protein PilO
LFVPLIFIVATCVTLVVFLLVKHQQRMTELMRSHPVPTDDRVLAELRELRQEMSEMKQRMGTMMLQLDARPSVSSATPPAVPEVAERLNG